MHAFWSNRKSIATAGITCFALGAACGESPVIEPYDGFAVTGATSEYIPGAIGSLPPGPALVRGCVLRNDEGEDVAVWGNPEHSDCAMLIPDEEGNCVSLQRIRGTEACWIEKAYGPGEYPDWNEYEQMAGGSVIGASYDRPIVRIIPIAEQSSTVEDIDWDCRDDAGALVRDGFYRIYLAGKFRFEYSPAPKVIWADVLLLHDPEARRAFIGED